MSLGEWLAFGGIALAVFQVVRLQTLTHATYEAVRTTSKQFSNYSLLLIIPDLARIEAECESAALRKDTDSIRGHIQGWRDAGAELRGFLRETDTEAAALLEDLQRSLSFIRRTKRDLMEDGTNSVEATQALRDAMTQVCESARTYGARLRTFPEIPEPPSTIGAWLGAKWGSRGKDGHRE